MKKIFSIIMIMVFTSINIFAQETNNQKPQKDYTSTEDEGFYFSNHILARWNHFGALYQGQLFYKKALFREKNNFFFAQSHITFGLEQEFSTFSRTSGYLIFQPLIALSFLFKATYETAFAESAKPVLTDDTRRFDFALPPFTGLNPQNKKPMYVGNDSVQLQVAPTLTIGARAGPGLIALIYQPFITYINIIGVDKNDYYYLTREAIVVKGQDIWFNHDLKLGYALPSLGMSFGINSTIEHMLSQKDLYRVGLFGVFSYKKNLDSLTSLAPFINLKVGTWLIERHIQYKFAIQIDTGLEWKFY